MKITAFGPTTLARHASPHHLAHEVTFSILSVGHTHLRTISQLCHPFGRSLIGENLRLLERLPEVISAAEKGKELEEKKGPFQGLSQTFTALAGADGSMAANKRPSLALVVKASQEHERFLSEFRQERFIHLAHSVV